jgi:adenine-specific DNA-methyltransferase
LKKIPKVVLSRCEWGHDDYSLNVQNLPMAQPDPEPLPTAKKKASVSPGQASLFGEDE